MPTAKRLQFSIRIEAPVARVWDVTIDPETYKKWTAAFMEGSHFQGSWEEGAEIRFLAPSGDGMVAVIEVNRPHEFISIKHIGCVANGVVDTESDEVKAWAPVYENYTFKAAPGGAEVVVNIDVLDEYEQYMNETWPKALASLKALCEKP